jgi:U1 small nuclear ribonucleoprotein C
MKYFCDYCDVYLTHDTLNARRSHNQGWKHKANVRAYYSQFLEQTQIINPFGFQTPNFQLQGVQTFTQPQMNPQQMMPNFVPQQQLSNTNFQTPKKDK